jgi:ATP-dependent DNA helicase DinG
MIGLHDEPGPAPTAVSHAPVLAAKTFAAQGWLQDLLRLEHRPQQEQMARAVAAAMVDDEVLLFEAGTGVGKSLAYLVPGLIHATDQARQLIVSTHTISLQEQIETKDLPLCRRLFGSVAELRPYVGFKSAILVGKANYLCPTRLAHALAGRQELFPSAEQAELQRLAAWAQETRDGLRHELHPPPSPEVWDAINADSSACSRKHCDPERCFYQRARARLQHAQVIIVNHSLLFALLNAGGASEKGGVRGVLFPDDLVVLDEAQTVPEVASEHFGLRLSSYGVDRLLKNLWHPQKKRGLLHRLGGAGDKQLVEDALEAAEQFFGFVRDRWLDQQTIVRVREEGFAEPWLDAPLLALSKAVGTLADRFDDGQNRDELLEQRGRLIACRTGLRQFLGLSAEDHVYWAERSGRRGQVVTLRTAPLDVAPYLREHLLQRRTSVVFTSATLALGGRCGGRVAVRLRAQYARVCRRRHAAAFARRCAPRRRRADRLLGFLHPARAGRVAGALHELQ